MSTPASVPLVSMQPPLKKVKVIGLGPAGMGVGVGEFCGGGAVVGLPAGEGSGGYVMTICGVMFPTIV